MQVIFMAGFASPLEAQSAVADRDGCTPDEKVEAIDALTPADAERFGVKAGQVVEWGDLNQRAKSIVDRVTGED
jgi:hypothetical protein